jgi:hypothetical protein
MDRRIEWINYQGDQILYADYSNLGEEKLAAAARETIRLLDEAVQRGDAYILLLLNLSGVKFSDRLPDELSSLSALRSQTSIYTAIVGLEGLPKKLVNLLLPDIELVDTITEGKEWLVNDLET